MNIYQDSAIDRTLWDKLIETSKFASPFQTPAFFDFFNQNPQMQAQVFAVGNSKAFDALCVVTLQKEKGIKGYFSRRAIIYGGLVLSPKISETKITLLLNSISTYYKKEAIYIETRNFFDYSEFSQLFKENHFQYTPWLNFHLHIESEEEVKSAMSKSRWRQIKKAQKQGASWKVAETEEEVMRFYEILQELYHDKIKKPLFDLDFFLRFFHSKIGEFLLVIFNEKVIGGIMCPIIPNRGIYEFYVCGKDQEHKDQYPSIMATWAAIEYAQQNEIPVFDFMGAGSPDESYGVRDFKARFGGESVEHGRYLKVLNSFLYKVGKIGLNILSKIK